MIQRLHGRALFERLARSGSRVHAGTLWCTFIHDPLVSPPRVAFAIGRAVGPAVTRNKVRRRLRALLHERHPDLSPGLYLIGARPAAAQRSFADLAADLARLAAKMAPTPASTPLPAPAVSTDG